MATRRYRKPKEYTYKRTAMPGPLNFNSLARGLESKEDLQKQKTAQEKELLQEEGVQQRKSQRHAAEIRKELGGGSKKDGLTTNQYVDAYEKFKKDYDMRHQGDKDFGSKAYRTARLNAFRDQMRRLTGQGSRGGGGGDLFSDPPPNKGGGGRTNPPEPVTKETKAGSEKDTAKTSRTPIQDKKPTKGTVDKAGQHARAREAEGKDPFAQKPPQDAIANAQDKWNSGRSQVAGAEPYSHSGPDFFTGGVEGVRHRAGVLQEGFDKAVQTGKVPYQMASRAAEGTVNAAQEVGEAIKESYMEAVRNEGGRVDLKAEDAPNLTANIIKSVFSGDAKSYELMVDSMEKLVGDEEEAPAAARNFLSDLAQTADNVGVDLQKAEPQDVNQLIEMMITQGGRQGRNMPDPNTTASGGPTGELNRRGVLPTLKQFDAE